MTLRLPSGSLTRPEIIFNRLAVVSANAFHQPDVDRRQSGHTVR